MLSKNYLVFRKNSMPFHTRESNIKIVERNFIRENSDLLLIVANKILNLLDRLCFVFDHCLLAKIRCYR